MSYGQGLGHYNPRLSNSGFLLPFPMVAKIPNFPTRAKFELATSLNRNARERELLLERARTRMSSWE
jgi:hypothetical protein